jgi:Na+-translocating ferredoxin:NAD+ oxidoreductase RNF subunit RnfB
MSSDTAKLDKNLIEYQIAEHCNGCTICAQCCPVSAIPAKPYRQHCIDTSVCTKCDICRRKCPNDAIAITVIGG